MTDPLHSQLDQIEHTMRNLRVMGDSGIRISGNLLSGLKVEMDKGEEAIVVTAPITPGTGACCVETDCTIETESDCIGFGGTYLGDGTICDPNPCAPCPPEDAPTVAFFSVTASGEFSGTPDPEIPDATCGPISFSLEASDTKPIPGNPDGWGGWNNGSTDTYYDCIGGGLPINDSTEVTCPEDCENGPGGVADVIGDFFWALEKFNDDWYLSFGYDVVSNNGECASMSLSVFTDPTLITLVLGVPYTASGSISDPNSSTSVDWSITFS